MHRLSILLVLVLSLGAAPGKPVSVQADKEMDAAVWIAEATIEKVDPASWMGRASDGGKVHLKVTSDPGSIFKGHAKIGKTLELKPPGWGASSCTTYLSDFAGKKTSVLFVARKDGSFPLIGERVDGAAERTYRLRSWCDYNAWWIFCIDKKFGKSVKIDADWGMTTIEVTAAEIRRRYLKESAPFVAKQVTFLTGARSLMTDEELSRQLARLGSDDVSRRDAAMKALTEKGSWSIAALKKAAAGTRDPEIRARIQVALDGLAEFTAAYDTAMEVRKRGVEAEARLLVGAWALLDKAHQGRALERLRKLAADAKPPLDAEETALVGAWRKRLKLK